MTFEEYIRSGNFGFFDPSGDNKLSFMLDPRLRTGEQNEGGFALPNHIGAGQTSNNYAPEDLAQQFFDRVVMSKGSDGNLNWGTSGIDFNNIGSFIPGGGVVDRGGRQFVRVGENIADPLFRQKLSAMNGSQNILKYFNQYDPASVSMYDPEAGWLMDVDKHSELMRAIDSTKSEGFFADNTPWDAFSKTIGPAMGIGSALTSLSNLGAGFATNALAGSGYESLFSSLGANAASQGGSLADLLGSFGINPTSIPDMPWGVNPRDGSTDWLNAPGSSGIDWGEIFQNYGTPASGASTLGAGGLESLLNPQSGMAQSLAPNFPGAQTPAFTGAGTTGLGLAAGGSIFKDLFTPKNLLSAGTNLLGSGLNAFAANQAAGAQVDSANASNSLIRDMYNQNRADLAPWRETGVASLGRLRDMLTPGNQFTALQADPGYQFRVDQGNKAIERSAASRGKLFSPQTMNAVGQRTQDVASNEFGNVSNRLMSLAGLGQSATNTGVAAGANAANQQAQNITGAGNARASGYVGTANAISGGLSNLLRGMQEQDLMNLIFGNR